MIVLEVSEAETETLAGAFKHVRVYCYDPCATVEDVTEEIERRWPGQKYWRQKPSAWSMREFDSNAAKYYIYARFSWPILTPPTEQLGLPSI